MQMSRNPFDDDYEECLSGQRGSRNPFDTDIEFGESSKDDAHGQRQLMSNLTLNNQPRIDSNVTSESDRPLLGRTSDTPINNRRLMKHERSGDAMGVPNQVASPLQFDSKRSGGDSGASDFYTRRVRNDPRYTHYPTTAEPASMPTLSHLSTGSGCEQDTVDGHIQIPVRKGSVHKNYSDNKHISGRNIDNRSHIRIEMRSPQNQSSSWSPPTSIDDDSQQHSRLPPPQLTPDQLASLRNSNSKRYHTKLHLPAPPAVRTNMPGRKGQGDACAGRRDQRATIAASGGNSSLPPPPLPPPHTPPPQVQKQLSKREKQQAELESMMRNLPAALDGKQENEVIRFLLSERVFGYPGTSGGRISNYIRYINNNHPFVSILFMHRLHPFSRKYRVIVFLCSLSFAVCVAFLLLNTAIFPLIATCRSSCDCQLEERTNPGTGQVVSAEYCDGGYNDGMSCVVYRNKCQYYQPWMLSAICGAFTVIYDAGIRFFATCGCLQGRSCFQNNCLGSSFKRLVEFFGGVTLLLFSFISIVLVAVTFVFCWRENIQYEVLLTLLIAELWCSVQWFVWSLPWFLFYFDSDRRYFYEQMREKQQVSAEQDPY